MVHSYWPEKIKKQKFNAVYVLLKHSDFCSGMPEMHSKRPRFKRVLGGGGMPPDPPPYKLGPLALQVTPSARVFSFSTYSKAFVIYVKPY